MHDTSRRREHDTEERNKINKQRHQQATIVNSNNFNNAKSNSFIRSKHSSITSDNAIKPSGCSVHSDRKAQTLSSSSLPKAPPLLYTLTNAICSKIETIRISSIKGNFVRLFIRNLYLYFQRLSLARDSAIMHSRACSSHLSTVRRLFRITIIKCNLRKLFTFIF